MESEWVTIGAFARASGLSQKALRLYDRLGVLVPARVDPVNGYRHYAPRQVERARLVARLRQLGMSLADVRRVCEAPGAEAAREVRDFWVRAEAESAARRDLAALLLDHLTPGGRIGPVGGPPRGPLGMRCAALSETGRVRESNQDAVYAGSRLLAVADGFGAGGAPAGAAAVEALMGLESAKALGDAADDPDRGGLDALRDSFALARRAVDEIARGDGTGGTGTTLTALLWTGSRLALAHVGDSRAYLLRDGGLFQITEDHTWVRLMVDAGRLTPPEAAAHPQRAALVRAFARDTESTPDTRLREVRPGDRYLLCSDGLSSVVAAERIRHVLATVTEPGRAVGRLVELADGLGAPDNVSCAVADLTPLQAA